MSRTYIYNAKLVNEGEIFQGSVVINGEEIEQVLRDPEIPDYSCDIQINAYGAYLLPGVIDEHVHFRDPGLIQKADIRSESIAAAAGGVTSIMDMPNTQPQTVTLEALAQKRELLARKCVVNYSCYFGATNDNIKELYRLDPHRVCGIKVFMGSSTGNMLVENEKALYDIFSIKGILIAAHCEKQSIINQNLEKFRPLIVDGDLPISYHSKIRSSQACFQSSSVAFRLAKKLGTRLHILHVSTIMELKLFGTQDVAEKNITAETCVGYLLFTTNDYRRKGSLIKVNPSIKSPNNRDSLYHAINEGRIDTIATDHAPHLLGDKCGGALKASSGMPMIQFSLVSMLELVTKGIFNITTVVDKMCHTPARLYEIHRRGFLRPGYKADLVLVKEINEREITNEEVLSKCQWTPLKGFKIHWQIMRTFINGYEIYDGLHVDESYRGEELIFR